MRRNLKRLLVVAGVAAIVWVLVAWGAALWLIVDAPLDRADAIVVLGGSATYKERTALAARLFREGRAPVVILTDDGQRAGWSRTQSRNPRFVELARAELLRQGVPETAIVQIPQTVGSTEDEAVALRGFTFSRGLKSVLVVTSAYHSRRALRTMRNRLSDGGITIGLTAAPPGEQTPRPGLWWLSARGWPLVAGEYAKLIYYRLAYWK